MSLHFNSLQSLLLVTEREEGAMILKKKICSHPICRKWKAIHQQNHIYTTEKLQEMSPLFLPEPLEQNQTSQNT